MAKDRTKPTECLLCGSTDKISRGLCDRHYRRFNAKLKKLQAEQTLEIAQEFEQKSIEKGLILPVSKGGKPRDSDPFDVLANIVVAESSGQYSHEDLARIIADGDRVIAHAKASRQSTESPQKPSRKAN